VIQHARSVRYTKLLEDILKHMFKGIQLDSTWYGSYLQVDRFRRKAK